jgi:hypothetical protein
MRKRSIIFAGVGFFTIIIIGITAYVFTRPSVTPTTYTKAKHTPIASKCLEERAGLRISSDDRNTVEQVAISYLIDVPAGTNVDVKIASYSENEVTGSDRYPAEYGNYNFIMSKRSGTWVTTDFKHCG